MSFGTVYIGKQISYSNSGSNSYTLKSDKEKYGIGEDVKLILYLEMKIFRTKITSISCLKTGLYIMMYPIHQPILLNF